VEQIVRHVLAGRRVVARQRQLVLDHKTAGIDTTASEEPLQPFEHTLALFERELESAQARGRSCGTTTDK
jgi:hypothetical protein